MVIKHLDLRERLGGRHPRGLVYCKLLSFEVGGQQQSSPVNIGQMEHLVSSAQRNRLSGKLR